MIVNKLIGTRGFINERFCIPSNRIFEIETYKVNKNILFIFGTRPEAIKLAPLIKEFEKYPDQFSMDVCSTGQHREMLNQVLGFFEIQPTYELDVMKPDQGLSGLTQAVLEGVSGVLHQKDFDYLYVQGDTTTAFAGALAGFYAGVNVCHVEAGLRTYNKQAPFPEEANRQLVSRIADIHFAPTKTAQQHLISEGIDPETIHITGNTVIDALFWGIEKLKSYESPEIEELQNLIHPDKKIVLVTGHRRESFGQGFEDMCQAMLEIANREDVQIIYPVHLNPNVQEPVKRLLGGHPNITLIDPLSYPAFIWLMNQCFLILTDSGGIQEEAPSLGKPVLVMRETTERTEAIEAGTAILVGTDPEKITEEVYRLLENPTFYDAMSGLENPYGDGTASRKIVQIDSVNA